MNTPVCGNCFCEEREHSFGQCPEPMPYSTDAFRFEALPYQIVKPHGGELELDLRVSARSALGKFIANIALSSNLLEVVENKCIISPASDHVLLVYGSKDDLLAFLDICIVRFRRIKAVYFLRRIRRIVDKSC